MSQGMDLQAVVTSWTAMAIADEQSHIGVEIGYWVTLEQAELPRVHFTIAEMGSTGVFGPFWTSEPVMYWPFTEAKVRAAVREALAGFRKGREFDVSHP